MSSGEPPKPPQSLLKVLAASSKEPAVKGALANAVRNLVREVRQADPNLPRQLMAS